jgi:hypothetical protein
MECSENEMANFSISFSARNRVFGGFKIGGLLHLNSKKKSMFFCENKIG